MGRPKEKKSLPPETDTQRVFLDRIGEEMARQEISESELARRARMNQKTFNGIRNGSVPKLTQVHKIALGLGIHVSELFKPSPAKQENLTNVRHLPERYGKIFAPHQQIRTEGKKRGRNTPR